MFQTPPIFAILLKLEKLKKKNHNDLKLMEIPIKSCFEDLPEIPFSIYNILTKFAHSWARRAPVPDAAYRSRRGH